MTRHGWIQRLAFGCLAVVIAIGGLVGLATRVGATTISVGCDAAMATRVATLIAAINAANNETTNPGSDTITLTADCTYTLSSVDADQTYGPSGLPPVTSTIVINGNNAIIERLNDEIQPQFRILSVTATGNLTLNDLILRNGNSIAIGGAINNEGGTLLLHRSTLTNNNADVHGGAVYSTGTLTIVDSTISDNSAEMSGGGIAAQNGVTVISGSTVSGNFAADSGGGLNLAYGQTTITNSTVSGNFSLIAGGGLSFLYDSRGNGSESLVMTNVTIVNNMASSSGGGGGLATLFPCQFCQEAASIVPPPASVAPRPAVLALAPIPKSALIANTIIAANTVDESGSNPLADCSGAAITTAGHNLTGNGTGCPTNATLGDLTISPANAPTDIYGLLQNNGGPTQTHDLVANSPAADAGDNALCADTPVNNRDQRGFVRPVNTTCDIGAVERGAAAPTPTPTPTVTSTPTVTPTPTNAPSTTATPTPSPTPLPTPGILPTTWYLAEGYTGPGFEEFLAIQNPYATDAAVTITYYLTGQAPVTKSFTVRGNTRHTVAVYDVFEGVGRGPDGAGLAVSAKVETTNGVGILVERPMYFTYSGRLGGVTGGHNVMAVPAPRQSWYFAEGYTGPGFDQYLTILNPHARTLPVTITYYLASGAPVIKTITVPARERYTVTVHDSREGVGPNQDVSAKVETSDPGGIVVERPIYFIYGGSIREGHNAMGAPAPQPDWYFADSSTTNGADTYLTIMNPNSGPAPVTITYYVAGEPTPRIVNLAVPATSRYTVSVHAAGQGIGRDKTASVHVSTSHTGGIVVERPVYLPGVGGTDVMGASTVWRAWYFSEGYTGPGFNEDLIIFNPNATTAEVTITYYLANATPIVRIWLIAPTTRRVINVNDPTTGAGPNLVVSAKVETTNPGGVVAERMMRFSHAGGPGAHTALGYTP